MIERFLLIISSLTQFTAQAQEHLCWQKGAGDAGARKNYGGIGGKERRQCAITFFNFVLTKQEISIL